MRPFHFMRNVGPGVALCAGLTALAYMFEAGESQEVGYAYVSALVLAILLGIGVRAGWQPGPRWQAGITFSGRTLLETAVMLLGASISLTAVAAAGAALVFGIAGVVAVAAAVSYIIGRLCGLSWRMAVLIACGNSICGNSAIAAVAPVIGADSRDITSAIAFTAILGVIVVLALPFLIPVIGLTSTQYGVFAGLTVYAVPQVLAATVPVSAVSAQIGTLVKLVRVLMLGPIVVLVSLAMGLFTQGDTSVRSVRTGFPLQRFAPWFILGFLLLGSLRSLGLIPHGVIGPLMTAANLLTVVAMAALGLDVDLRVLPKVGGRVTTAVSLSLLTLMGISFALIRWLAIA